MIFKFILILVWAFSHYSSLSKKEKTFLIPKICGWYSEPSSITEEEITKTLLNFKNEGIECINYGTDSDKYDRVAKISLLLNIQLFAWMPVLLGIGKDKQWLYDNHPEAYVINKNGQKSHDSPIFVPHYKFLCPNHEIVISYLVHLFDKVSKIDGIDGINLDYIRFIEANLKNYNSIGDTCYCEICIEKFLNKTNRTITNSAGTNDDNEFNNFRVESITKLVNILTNVIHSNHKLVSADVYPGPWQSTHQTRQEWDHWNVDMIFPMIYTGVFNKDVNWIGAQTGEGNAKLKEINSNSILYTGLQAEIMNDNDFKRGIEIALKNGAFAISVFKLNSMTPEKFKILREKVNEYYQKKGEEKKFLENKIKDQI